MTIAGLPGIPGGSALVPALDMFIADALLEHHSAKVTGSPQEEVCGALIYRHLEPSIGPLTSNGTINVEWTGEVDWVRLENTHPAPGDAFSISTAELMQHVQAELKSLEQICTLHHTPEIPAAAIFGTGFSPLVGICHSHPSGASSVSAADHRMSDGAATWRRATAPGTLVHGPEEAKFFEADFLLAVDPERSGHGTLVHFKRGSVRGTWEGNFLPKD